MIVAMRHPFPKTSCVFNWLRIAFVPNPKRAFPMGLERGCPSAASQIAACFPTEATADFFI
jgi:hypothetical protein